MPDKERERLLPMKSLIVFILLLASSYLPAASWEETHLVSACRIYQGSGLKLREFPGQICIFLNDGKFLSATSDKLRLFGVRSEVIWELDGHFHHQLNLSPDGKRILTLSSAVNDKIRTDKFMVISMEGKILAERNASELLMGKVPFLRWPVTDAVLRDKGILLENSHFNSIYEIPAQTNKKSPFQAGQIVVNGLVQGILVLSPDLKSIIRHVIYQGSKEHSLHDVQVTASGNFLVFNNEMTGKNSHTSVDEFEPINQKIVYQFKADPPEVFYSKNAGGVQEFGANHLIVSSHLSGTYLINRKTNKVESVNRNTHMDTFKFMPVQQVKAQNLSGFLSHWPSL